MSKYYVSWYCREGAIVILLFAIFRWFVLRSPHPIITLSMATNGTTEPSKAGNVNQANIEQFRILAKSVKGLAAVQLIKQCIEHQHIFVFGEFLDQLKSLQESNEHTHWYRLLEIFAFGTLSDYQRDAESLPSLSPLMLKKLRHLTLITLAMKHKRLTYELLSKELSTSNVRELEDLLIDAIYSNIIDGKMDQKNSCIEIESTIARDIRKDQLQSMLTILSDWCDKCDNMIATMETQMQSANQSKVTNFRLNQDLDSKIAKLREKSKSIAS